MRSFAGRLGGEEYCAWGRSDKDGVDFRFILDSFN